MALAMALVDRALAMAPDDPRVLALEAQLAAGAGRRRWLIAGVATVALAGLVAGAWRMTRGGGDLRVAAPIDAPGDDGLVVPGPPLDGGAAVPVIADAAPPRTVDAASSLTAVAADADAGRPRLDAGHLPSSVLDASAARMVIDAATVTPIDAAVAPPVVDAAAALVAVTFTFDTWCNLTVDDVAHGRANKVVTVRLTPGPHVATCSQGPGLGSWSRTLDVADGAANRIQGDLLPTVEVVVGVGDEVRIDGTPVARGRSLAVKLGPHRVEVVVGGKVVAAARISIPGVARCTLRDQPSLDCYP